MRVRKAQPMDLNHCTRIDGSYVTGHVWQIVSGGGARLQIARAKLPREIAVAYPIDQQGLAQDIHRDVVLLADELGEMLGMADMRFVYGTRTAWIEYLVTNQPFRRQGVARGVLGMCEEMAARGGMTRVILPVPLRADPAVAFLSNRGYQASGYLSDYDARGETAILFSRMLEHSES